MCLNLDTKVVVITGASRGIGSELARAFAREDAKVVINYNKSEEEANNLYAEIYRFNKNVMIYKADVSKTEEILGLYQATLARFGTVDILVNNAGILADADMKNMAWSDWNRVIDVNLNGTFICSKIFSETMIEKKCGKIINIASIKGQKGSKKQVNYAASKAGVIGLTKSLAKELAVYNICVNAVCPGYIVTDLNRYSKDKYIKAVEESYFEINNNLHDLLNFVLFISSDKILSITGRVYNLDSRI